MSDYMADMFKTRPKNYSTSGQCFECGLWFSRSRGYAFCKEHGKRRKGFAKSTLCASLPVATYRSQ